MRVALFVTCFNDALYPQTGKAVVHLLERLGHEVVFPQAQTCCGQMHVNTGYYREALPLARRFAGVFDAYEAIVSPSPSCVGTVREQYGRIAERTGDEALRNNAASIVPRVHELSEFLVDVLGVEDVGAYFPHRVTYHPTCHSLRGLHVGDRPLRLLEAVKGLTLTDLPAAEECCGFGGTFALKNAEVSVAMGADTARPGDGGAGSVRSGQLLPDAHRGDAVEGAIGDAGVAPGRDPRQLGGVGMSDGTSNVSVDLGPDAGRPAAGPVGKNRPPSKVWVDQAFPVAARVAVRDSQLRHNLERATATIRGKRDAVVGELPDWEELRLAGAALKDEVLANLDRYLLQVEERVTAAGGQVHWARDAAEANRIVVELVTSTGVDEVVKVKSMATMEIELNEALAEAGVAALETDLAELIVQLGDDRPSHILVPAIHKNRAEIRELFLRTMPDAPRNLTDEPRELAAAARKHLRRKFLSAKVAISGANFVVAETGTLVVVESEGNGRMCLTLPETLISVVGIEKVVPTWQDLEVFLQLLPRSSTGERMNPYTSTWTGVTPGDGPQTFHLVLLDNGRTRVLADAVGRQALRCIRCSACLNVCPVYERTGGHAYGSVYPGPIGAILNPLQHGTASARDRSLPYASTLCGRCFEVCPVRIDIPEVLVHLRGTVVDGKREARVPSPEMAAMKAAAFMFAGPRRLAAGERLASLTRHVVGRKGRISRLPGPMRGWSEARDAPAPPVESFRAWWKRTRGTNGKGGSR